MFFMDSSGSSFTFFSFYLFCCLILTFFLIVLPFCMTRKTTYNKYAPYECGFESFGSSREAMNVHSFSLIILFVIFEIELLVILPLFVNGLHNFLGFFSFFFFLVILLTGFFYETKSGFFDLFVTDSNFFDFH